ncbi:hypothetical protein COXBURSA331_A1664 [Coxiella burnetii RSA 331]|nr:hypothetical protein COXBURSA331_A1664 [Coxiella burnetii RSA 331]EDR35525.1 hypothetical protein COXBURSA334_0471 [Coxiella burnetii Q321]
MELPGVRSNLVVARMKRNTGKGMAHIITHKSQPFRHSRAGGN